MLRTYLQKAWKMCFNNKHEQQWKDLLAKNVSNMKFTSPTTIVNNKTNL
jgi:hypothetical protein